jgi:hypothetical protein
VFSIIFAVPSYPLDRRGECFARGEKKNKGPGGDDILTASPLHECPHRRCQRCIPDHTLADPEMNRAAAPFSFRYPQVRSRSFAPCSRKPCFGSYIHVRSTGSPPPTGVPHVPGLGNAQPYRQYHDSYVPPSTPARTEASAVRAYALVTTYISKCRICLLQQQAKFQHLKYWSLRRKNT